MKRIFLAGHNGMVGSAILRLLQAEGSHEVITASHAQLDLTDQTTVERFMRAERPDTVILAAARVGGIMANSRYPAQFIHDNLAIQTNTIHQAYRAGVERLLFLGSSCIYPRQAPQPIPEEALLAGPLESTNEPYAIAKIAGIKLCESYNRQYGADYRSVMPTNLYGPGDNFHPENAHVLPSLIRRFHEAALSGTPRVTVWGTGTPRREFLHVDDMAAASLFVLNLPKEAYESATKPTLSHLNIGTGSDITIRALAETVAEVTGFRGEIIQDMSKPDGTPQKLLDVSRINDLGWSAKIPLHDGIASTHTWYRDALALTSRAG